MASRLLAWVALAGTTACSSAAAPAAPDAGEDVATVEASVMFDVSGTIVDGSNAGWAGAHVQVCSETLCNLGTSDAAGAFRVAVPPGAGYHVIARPAATDPREASAGLGIVGDVASDVAVGPIVIPVMGPKTALALDAGVATVAVTSDLTLTTRASDLLFEGDAYVAGASIPQAKWPAFAAPGETVLAMWALDPFGTDATTGKTIAVSIANGYGLGAGATVSVYAVNELTAALGPPSQGVVSSDGTTLGGATVDRLTWIVLATP